LILYVLQHTDFTVSFLQTCGPQFHAAIRNYLCVSLLKNCTSDNVHVVSLSLRIFVPVVRNFRTILKTEIEAFVTNVFFVILDSKNSPAEHKSIVVNTFNEICSDPNTLAEIFLNYDCDLSAVDLFHRIVNTLSRLSRSGLLEPNRGSSMTSSFLGGGPSEAQMEKFRNESRELRLDAMRALRQILASLHASIVEPMGSGQERPAGDADNDAPHRSSGVSHEDDGVPADAAAAALPSNGSPSRQNLVEIYGSKKKRRAEESEAILRFNQKPSAGIAYAAKCGHIDSDDPADVARYLLKNKDELDKSMIGEYLGREVDYQNGFSMKVLHEYVRLMDFTDLVFDDAIRYFLSGFRLPGEAQKVRSCRVTNTRIVEELRAQYFCR
jgi:brefeldin A-inhibited guanine nucleotide-exchange protein